MSYIYKCHHYADRISIMREDTGKEVAGLDKDGAFPVRPGLSGRILLTSDNPNPITKEFQLAVRETPVVGAPAELKNDGPAPQYLYYGFLNGADNYLYSNMVMPSDWIIGTPLEIKIDWYFGNNVAGDVDWVLDAHISTPGSSVMDVTNPSTTYPLTVSNDLLDTTHMSTILGTIDMSAVATRDVTVDLRLSRLGTTDTFASLAYVMSWGCLYQSPAPTFVNGRFTFL